MTNKQIFNWYNSEERIVLTWCNNGWIDSETAQEHLRDISRKRNIELGGRYKPRGFIDNLKYMLDPNRLPWNKPTSA